MSQHFFRQEALRTNLNHLHGAPCAITAFPYQTVTRAICILIPLFLLFVLFMPYSEQYTVRGYLDSNQGIARVYPPESGILYNYDVNMGQHVKQGDILLRVSTYDGHVSQSDRQHIFEQLQQRKDHLLQSLQSKQKHLQALKPLLTKKYISNNIYQREADDILTLEQSIMDATQALSKYKHAQIYTIKAPISGLVTNITPKTGQQIYPSKPILDIIPDHTTLIAQLMIPVSKIGYIHADDPIILHYDAYPDQHSKLSVGKIQHINQTISTENIAHQMSIQAEPYYKAIGILQQQTILIHGIERPLQLGMTCSIVIQGARKKIWQWMLDPLFRFHDTHLGIKA